MSKVRDILVELFESFNEEVVYVVPRKYENLPDVPEDGEIDFIIKEQDFDQAVEIAEELGFSKKPESRFKNNRIANIGIKALNRPRKATKMLLFSPKTVYNKAINSGSIGGHRNLKLEGHGIVLDLRDGLAYKSTWDNRRVKADLELDDRMFRRRKMMEKIFYVPSKKDELAHLIPHCIFDKKGEFSDYYVRRCAKLCQQVEDKDELNYLLSKVFYRASSLVIEKVDKGEFDDILEELYRFSDY